MGKLLKYMLPLVLTLALNAAARDSEAWEFRTLRMVEWRPQHFAAEQFAFQTREQLARVWKSDGGAIAGVPYIDNEKETALAIFAGEKVSGGYGVKIEWYDAFEHTEPGAKPAGKPNTYLFGYRVTAPAKDALTTQAITFPSHVVVVPKITGSIKFIDVESEIGQAFSRERERRQAAQKDMDALALQLEKQAKEQKKDKTEAEVEKRLKKLGTGK